MRSMFWLRLSVGAVLGAAVGAALVTRTTPVFQATASVLVGDPVPVSAADPGSADGTGAAAAVNMLTEAELVRSTGIVADAHARLAADPAQAGWSGTLVAVEPVPGTSVLTIKVEAGSAGAAQAGARAFAESYLAGREQAARSALDAARTAVQQRLDDARGRLTDTNNRIAALPRGSAQLAPLQAAAASLTEQVTSLSTRLDELAATPVNPGRVVGEPALPSAPVRPQRLLYLGLGALAGVLVAAVADLLAQRGARRVRRASDLRRHREVPLLAALDATALVTGVGTPASGVAAQQTFNRLRNEVVAALDLTDRTIVVSAVSPGPAGLLVAANLAAALARAEADVVLVGASAPDLDSIGRGTTLAGLFDLADIPGLTDVLASRTSLARAVQRAARSPRLRVVTPGGTASATGLLQSEGARAVLRQLAAKTRYVVVEAPSTAAGADAQSLASAADVALLVVETGRALHREVSDAVTQLARVGARLLGAVVVPRLDAGDLPTGRGGPQRPGRGSARRSSERPAGPREPGAAEAGYDTEGWIDSTPDALDGPTRVLEPINRPTRGRLRDDAPPQTVRRGTTEESRPS